MWLQAEAQNKKIVLGGEHEVVKILRGEAGGVYSSRNFISGQELADPNDRHHETDTSSPRKCQQVEAKVCP